jgi:NAD(P)H dehydrogenase (quinone)
MNVLTVYAHHNPKSFCHAVLEKFNAGLADGGHRNEIVDLHAIRFDPVFSARDTPNWIDESVPPDLLVQMRVKQSVLDSAGGPLRRFLVKRRIREMDDREIIGMLREHRPRDVTAQQEKVARAEALAFISPLYFVGFPAILKGWIERVFTLGFAFGLKPEAWRGDIGGRVPLLTHKKALIINTTIFNEDAYRSGLGEAMATLVDEFALRYPGVRKVEHVYFFAVHGADEVTRQSYLERAYMLGKEFAHGCS